MLADKFAEADDVEDTMLELESAKWRASKYGLVPENVHRVKAKDILKGLYSHGDFCWVDVQGCPTTQTLLAGKPERIDEYLQAREQHAAEGSSYKWKDSVLGLYGHWRKKTKVLSTRWHRRAEVLNAWDKTMNGRNLQKCLQLAQTPKCPLCELTADTQAHMALRCSHPVILVAREGFQSEIRARIRMEDPGPGRAYLWEMWRWVFHPREESCTVAEEMARIGFMVGRPLRSTLRMASNVDDHRLSRGDRAKQTKCVLDLMDTAAIYLRQVERLKMSISAAPEPVRRRLRCARATVNDVKGLLQRPYLAKDQNTRAKMWRASLATFGKLRRCTPSSVVTTDEEEPSTEPCTAPVQSQAQPVWQPEWSQWEPTGPAPKASIAEDEGPDAPARSSVEQQVEIPGDNPCPAPKDVGTTQAPVSPVRLLPSGQQDGVLPLVSEFPGIPQWAVPFPLIREREECPPPASSAGPTVVGK